VQLDVLGVSVGSAW